MDDNNMDDEWTSDDEVNNMNEMNNMDDEWTSDDEVKSDLRKLSAKLRSLAANTENGEQCAYKHSEKLVDELIEKIVEQKG